MYMKQKLRFENFLKDYVRDLSFGTTSIKKLVAECEDFPKLREPLFLYAKFNGKLKLLYSVLEKTPNGELQHLCDTYGSTLTIELTKAEKNAILSQVRLNVQMYHDACMCANAEVDENRLPKEKIPMGTDLEEIAAYIREALHLPASGPVGNLAQTLERSGVFVTIIKRNAIAKSFSSLAAMTTNGVPIVAISSGLDRYGQREELTHVLMYLLFSDINERILNNAVEYFLLPSEDIIRELGRKRKSLCAKEIRIIAEKYGVFEKCVVRRAKKEGIINRKWQNNIQNIIVDERKAELPTRLLQIVLRAYTEGETSISRAAELLQTDSSTAATTLKE